VPSQTTHFYVSGRNYDLHAYVAGSNTDQRSRLP
jgi:hypothetical protein